MRKKEIRSLFRKKREDVSVTDKMKWDDLLLIQFQTIELPFLEYVFSFYPVQEYNEIDTFPITDYLHFKNPNLHICYPRTNLIQGSMEAVVCNADSIFEANEFNIPEPLDNEVAHPELLDIILVPMFAFDLDGYRVGYGKGYYDRYLKNCRPDALKIGLCYFEPVDSVEDANEFDVPLDICITPHRTYVF
jgi:5-formyltetrahydrofolate cyclo-ligase